MIEQSSIEEGSRKRRCPSTIYDHHHQDRETSKIIHGAVLLWGNTRSPPPAANGNCAAPSLLGAETEFLKTRAVVVYIILVTKGSDFYTPPPRIAVSVSGTPYHGARALRRAPARRGVAASSGMALPPTLFCEYFFRGRWWCIRIGLAASEAPP